MGNRLSLTDEAGTVIYDHDAAHRLTREEKSFLDGGANQVTTYGWDANGQLAQKTSSGGTSVFEWDPLGRLEAITGGGATTRFGYRPDGGRSFEEQAGQTRRFLHSSEDLVGVYDDSGTLLTYYSHGPGIDEPLGQVQGGVSGYLHHDALGSIVAASDAKGSLSGAVGYSPFGSIEAGASPIDRFAFTGREQDPGGLMYYRARYYQPEVGRFASVDPFAGLSSMPQTLHPYTYVRNDPANLTDPSGQSWILKGLGLGLGLVALALIACQVFYVDLVGHFLAGFGATLAFLGIGLLAFAAFAPVLAPVWGWVIGITTFLTLISIGGGLYLEATQFNTNGFDALDAWAQSLGAIAAGILLLIVIWFLGPLGLLTAEMWLSLIGGGVVTLLAGAPFAFYGLLPKPGDPFCKPRPQPGGP